MGSLFSIHVTYIYIWSQTKQSRCFTKIFILLPVIGLTIFITVYIIIILLTRYSTVFFSSYNYRLLPKGKAWDMLFSVCLCRQSLSVHLSNECAEIYFKFQHKKAYSDLILDHYLSSFCWVCLYAPVSRKLWVQFIDQIRIKIDPQ